MLSKTNQMTIEIEKKESKTPYLPCANARKIKNRRHMYSCKCRIRPSNMAMIQESPNKQPGEWPRDKSSQTKNLKRLYGCMCVMFMSWRGWRGARIKGSFYTARRAGDSPAGMQDVWLLRFSARHSGDLRKKRSLASASSCSSFCRVSSSSQPRLRRRHHHHLRRLGAFGRQKE